MRCTTHFNDLQILYYMLLLKGVSLYINQITIDSVPEMSLFVSLQLVFVSCHFYSSISAGLAPFLLIDTVILVMHSE